MKVYRYLSQSELENIIEGNTDKIGHKYNKKIMPIPNTHKYVKGVKYLHFFKNKSDIEYVKEMHIMDAEDYYTCTFNVPITTLIKHRGKGSYEYINGGYDNDTDSVVEYAIPVSEFDTRYFVSSSLDKAHHQTVVLSNKTNFQQNSLDDNDFDITD